MPTNFEKIKNMNVDEMAEIFEQICENSIYSYQNKILLFCTFYNLYVDKFY